MSQTSGFKSIKDSKEIKDRHTSHMGAATVVNGKVGYRREFKVYV